MAEMPNMQHPKESENFSALYHALDTLSYAEAATVRGNRRLAGDNGKNIHRAPRGILGHPRFQGWVQGRVGGGVGG